jgi:hypothetical protein
LEPSGPHRASYGILYLALEVAYLNSITNPIFLFLYSAIPIKNRNRKISAAILNKIKIKLYLMDIIPLCENIEIYILFIYV